MCFCAAPLSGYPSIEQLSEFQVSKWYELGLYLKVPIGRMEDIKKSASFYPTTETFLAAKVNSITLSWEDVVEGLQKIGECCNCNTHT